MSSISAVIMCIVMFFQSFGFFCTKPVFSEIKPATEKPEYNEGVFKMNSHDLIVSPDGNDTNDGSLAYPLATISEAKKRLKNIDYAERITVWFREGTYRIENSLNFDSTDKDNVTYRSYPNEKVVFSGTKEIKNFKESTVNGVRAFVADYDAGDNESGLNTLYKGDKRLPRPIYPKSGNFEAQNMDKADCLAPEIEPYFKLPCAFYAKPENVLYFKNINDVDVRILHYWHDELLPVSKVNANSGRIELLKPASMAICEGDRFFFENVFESLCEPNEWYYDRSAKKLYYIPEANETPENMVLNLGVNQRLITIDGAYNISFEGIDFCDTDWNITGGEHFVQPSTSGSDACKNIKYSSEFPQGCYDKTGAITTYHCHDINFENCRFERIGEVGVLFGNGSKYCSVKSCYFEDMGSNGVFIKGAKTKDEKETTSHIEVIDNRIKTYGRIFNCAIGVLLTDATHCTISHNEISDGYYTAISVGWNWGYSENYTDYIEVSDNLIYNIGQGWLSDMGGIYTLGIQENTVLRGNVIHDVGCYAGSSGYGGWGIYLDEGSSGILVEKNLVYKCSSDSFHQHYGKDNMIVNNIFALSSEAQVRSSKEEGHNQFTLEKNIIVSDNASIYNFINNGREFKDDSNLYWDYTNRLKVKNTLFSLVEVKKLGLYKNGIIANPLFKDPLNGDFTLAENTPAKKIGFEAFDYSKAGMITQK